MARTPDKIKSIDGSRETLKLAIRITDLWFVGTPNKSEQAEIVIVDSDGDEIYVVCKADQLKSWKADLKENSTYVMHNFKVMKNDGQFRVCEHQYKLVFIGVIVVGQSNLDDLPFKEFRFVEFSNIIYGNFEAGLLFLAYLNEIENDGPMVIILTHARIKEGQGKYDVIFASCGAHYIAFPIFFATPTGSYPPSVSNLLKASQLLINEPVLEIQEFRERIVMDNHSWCYPTCIQCHKKTDIEAAPFKCGCGKENDQPVLRVQPKFRNVVVLRYSNELDLINVVLDMLPDTEACSKVDSLNLDCNDAPQVESIS
ncbi:hypothetical protein JHK87_055227 [Glycine soja]|nr:hypothetical protein JHK87_055227 [Glycine soja]